MPSPISTTVTREFLEERAAFVEALLFYGDVMRYRGPNQRREPEPDVYSDEAGMTAYALDVTRDAGRIARDALLSVRTARLNASAHELREAYAAQDKTARMRYPIGSTTAVQFDGAAISVQLYDLLAAVLPRTDTAARTLMLQSLITIEDVFSYVADVIIHGITEEGYSPISGGTARAQPVYALERARRALVMFSDENARREVAELTKAVATLEDENAKLRNELDSAYTRRDL